MFYVSKCIGHRQKKKKKKDHLSYYVVYYVLFMLRTYTSAKILFSHGMHGSSLQVL
jgi:hypothetical protein